MSTIDEVKARLDIVETVSRYVPDLKKSGRTYKALCPFHSERTPSFTVDPGRGSWHCFGACSTGGDVIEFVRRFEQLEFPEALRLCADRAGVELRPPSRREQQQLEAHERLLRANEAAAVFFDAALDGPAGVEALRYIDERGLDPETRKTWQLGYAPEGWRGLLDHLLARGFAESDLLEAGLAVKGDSDARGQGGVYDRFRHRLIFPTRDGRGRLIGFGARALRPDDEPKYLNTPQTPLFDKSGTLYGLDRAGDASRRADRMVVVEGYMDVIAAHQFGIENVVASMGTAITEKQMALVKRFTQNVVLALDADTAGSEATLRGVQVAAAAADRETVATLNWRGLVAYQDVLQADIRVVSMPHGQDPDTVVRADPERFRALVDGAQPVTDHLFDAVTTTTDSADSPLTLAGAGGAGADRGGHRRPRGARALRAAACASRARGRADGAGGAREARPAARTRCDALPQGGAAGGAASARRPGRRDTAAVAAAAPPRVPCGRRRGRRRYLRGLHEPPAVPRVAGVRAAG